MCAEGDWVAMPGGCVGVLGHADYQPQGTPKSFHRDTENSVAVAFPFLQPQDASYKTCLLGLVFS